MSTWCVVVAAGKGERAGLGMNKAFYPLQGRTLLSRCLDALTASKRFDGIALVLSNGDRELWDKLLREEGEQPLVKRIATGGATRQASVYNGLKMLPEDTDLVAVHDAARPFVTEEIIEATLEAAARTGSGVISTQVTDTIKQIDREGRVVTLPRESLRSVQTPQVFSFTRLLQAHERAAAEGFTATDDAALFEKYYGTVHLVTAKGAEQNIKMTRPEDFARRERKAKEMRVGCGYDAHRLVEGRELVLCGVQIPWDKGLDGHSDADVAVHALMDALLGAAGEGDIGRHFPDTDPAYKGISSMLLLRKTMEILAGKGFEVVNADITIVAQRPKLAPFIEQMRRNISEALACDSVNVKATTTEGMGFEGRGEGISSHAVVMLQREMA